MNARIRAILMAAVCVLAVGLLLAGCTRPKPTPSPTPQPTPPQGLTPAATAAPGMPTLTPTPMASPAASEATATPTPEPFLPPEPTATPAPQLPEPTPEPGTSTYTVQPGDTLYGIAARFGTTVNELAALNNLAPDALLMAGQVLVIPGGATNPPNVHIVQAGENLYRIALRYGITWQELAQLNGITDPTTLRAGQRLVLPAGATGTQPTTPSGTRTHVVQPGDTLYGIAARYGVSAQALAQANGLTLSSYIYPGQTLIIP
ncbi:MAG: LysM peptidoglycan-binding domain-containing protein [Chloroflexi bacterium]|nr:LysM peptidoglycan-binding domain-containing protein [Chloroflexota bacterium]